MAKMESIGSDCYICEKGARKGDTLSMKVSIYTGLAAGYYNCEPLECEITENIKIKNGLLSPINLEKQAIIRLKGQIQCLITEKLISNGYGSDTHIL